METSAFAGVDLIARARWMFLAGCVVLHLGGRTAYAPIQNGAVDQTPLPARYSLADYYRGESLGDQRVMLAFSGGGTRAAALSYGLLKALRAGHEPIQPDTIN